MWHILNNRRWDTGIKRTWYGLGCMLVNHPHGFAQAQGAPDSTGQPYSAKLSMVPIFLGPTQIMLWINWPNAFGPKEKNQPWHDYFVAERLRPPFEVPFQTLSLLGSTEEIAYAFPLLFGMMHFWWTSILPIFKEVLLHGPVSKFGSVVGLSLSKTHLYTWSRSPNLVTIFGSTLRRCTGVCTTTSTLDLRCPQHCTIQPRRVWKYLETSQQTRITKIFYWFVGDHYRPFYTEGYFFTN